MFSWVEWLVWVWYDFRGELEEACRRQVRREVDEILKHTDARLLVWRMPTPAFVDVVTARWLDQIRLEGAFPRRRMKMLEELFREEMTRQVLARTGQLAHWRP